MSNYSRRAESICLENTHRTSKPDFWSCYDDCRRNSCSCMQYRSAPSELNCRWAGHGFHGTATSKAGFDAWVLDGAQPLLRSEATGGTCISAGSILKPPSSGPLVTPRYFMLPPLYDDRTLLACYAAQHKGNGYPFSADSAFWLARSLAAHPARVHGPNGSAELWWVPNSAALSEAAGTCAGNSHHGRMMAAADALRSASSFRLKPSAHFVVNSVASTMRSSLGELGELVSRSGGYAACLDPHLCGAFKQERSISLPWPTIPALLTSFHRRAVDDEACGKRRMVRSVVLYFRGSLGSSGDAQSLRMRLQLLRGISGAQITLIGNEKVRSPLIESDCSWRPPRAVHCSRTASDYPRLHLIAVVASPSSASLVTNSFRQRPLYTPPRCTCHCRASSAWRAQPMGGCSQTRNSAFARPGTLPHRVNDCTTLLLRAACLS